MEILSAIVNLHCVGRTMQSFMRLSQRLSVFSLACCCCRIAVFGLAFLIAAFTQLQAAFTRNFHYDMKDDLPTWFMWILVVTGNATLTFCCFSAFSSLKHS